MAGELLTADAQIQWRGMLLGSGTVYGTKSIQGWLDLPGQRGSNPALPSSHGAYPGRKLSTERLVVFEYKLRVASLADFAGAVAALRTATAPGEDPQEEELAIRLGGESLMTWARVLRRSIPVERHYSVGYTEGAIEWEATDPRQYSVDELSTGPIPLAASAGGGVDFSGGGVDFSGGGVDFGSGTAGGRGTATNAGDVPTWPRLEITGPCPGPVVAFPGGRRLVFNPAFTVAAGQTLVIDTRPGVARTVKIGSVSMRDQLWTAQWTPLEPDIATDIRFSAAGYHADARLEVFWRHASH